MRCSYILVHVSCKSYFESSVQYNKVMYSRSEDWEMSATFTFFPTKQYTPNTVGFLQACMFSIYLYLQASNPSVAIPHPPVTFLSSYTRYLLRQYPSIDSIPHRLYSCSILTQSFFLYTPSVVHPRAISVHSPFKFHKPHWHSFNGHFHPIALSMSSPDFPLTQEPNHNPSPLRVSSY